MTEAEWLARETVDAMLTFLRSNASQRKLRLFAVECCRLIPDVSADGKNQAALALAERFAEGGATQSDLRKVYQTVQAVADDYAPDECVAFTLHRYAFGAASRAAFWSRVVVGVIADNAATQDERKAAREWAHALENARQGQLLHELFGNPFRPVTFDPAWRTTDVMLLARGIYEEKAFDRMPILADALQDAGCDNEDILGQLRDPKQKHVRGCWALDLVLGKE